MPPLPEALTATLKAAATAALAALMVIAGAHRELFDWASKAICGGDAPQLCPRPRSNGGGRLTNAGKTSKRAKSNGHREPRGDARLVKRDADDEGLIRAMRTNAEGPIRVWAAAIGKSRSSVLTALHRLRDADLVESVECKWRVIEPGALAAPPPKWVAPVRGTDKAAYAHLTAS
jgi:hypothetical protein